MSIVELEEILNVDMRLLSVLSLQNSGIVLGYLVIIFKVQKQKIIEDFNKSYQPASS